MMRQIVFVFLLLHFLPLGNRLSPRNRSKLLSRTSAGCSTICGTANVGTVPRGGKTQRATICGTGTSTCSRRVPGTRRPVGDVRVCLDLLAPLHHQPRRRSYAVVEACSKCIATVIRSCRSHERSRRDLREATRANGHCEGKALW